MKSLCSPTPDQLLPLLNAVDVATWAYRCKRGRVNFKGAMQDLCEAFGMYKLALERAKIPPQSETLSTGVAMGAWANPAVPGGGALPKLDMTQEEMTKLMEDPEFQAKLKERLDKIRTGPRLHMPELLSSEAQNREK